MCSKVTPTLEQYRFYYANDADIAAYIEEVKSSASFYCDIADRSGSSH